MRRLGAAGFSGSQPIDEWQPGAKVNNHNRWGWFIHDESLMEPWPMSGVLTAENTARDERGSRRRPSHGLNPRRADGRKSARHFSSSHAVVGIKATLWNFFRHTTVYELEHTSNYSAEIYIVSSPVSRVCVVRFRHWWTEWCHRLAVTSRGRRVHSRLRQRPPKGEHEW